MTPSPRVESWNACALPWKLVAIVAGSSVRAACSTCADRVAERDARAAG